VFDYTVSGGDVSKGRDGGAASDRENSLVNPPFNRRSVLPAGVSVRPGRVSLVRLRVPGCAGRRRSGLPGLCRCLIGLPRRRVRVPRRCRVRAARIGMLPRGRCGSLPGCAGPLAGWRTAPKTAISHAPTKTRATRAMTSTAAGDTGEPGSGRRSLLRRQAAGAAHGPCPGTGGRGRRWSRRPGWAVSARCESHGPGRSRKWHPAADLHKFLTW